MPRSLRPYLDVAGRLLAADSPKEREKRAAHWIALLLVSTVAIAKYVVGLTDPRAPFTVFPLVVAAAAARGGFEPALVATLASVVLGGLAAPLPPGAGAQLLFVAEGVAIALVVSALRSRAEASDAARRGAEAMIDQLRQRGYEQTANHAARCREWDADRAAAAHLQAALQESADETRQQLDDLESLTDPSLNPLEGPAAVSELLERLRVTIGADGAALVRPGRVSVSAVAARGLEAAAGPMRAETFRLAPGRVAVVHNDAARVQQLSALTWSRRVASLLIVPVMHNGQVRSTIEVVSERSRQIDDRDVALVRIVADRLASVVVQGPEAVPRAS